MKNLDDLLGMPPAIVPDKPLVIVPETSFDDEDVDTDYKLARENIHQIITKGSELLDNMTELAIQSESPRAYEVAANLMKTMTEANKDLLNLQKQKRDIKQPQDKSQPVENRTQTNNIFVGTTAELQRLIRNG